MLISLAFAIPQTITAQAAQQATRDQGDNLRPQQITDRFSMAIKQLGNHDNLVLRLGGIYSLKRIIQDSRECQPMVNLLTTFVREATGRGPAAPTSRLPSTCRPRSPWLPIGNRSAMIRRST
ncbi:hypothetical protein [Sciscionella sediminilitoris]|uniref:hypothetical protein n=1 Tax=Sciscionella sediminilitoris TaxID=1445613 RepID=UPI0006EB33FB|nr:hypothetical protein [Sciscionella sp. SE31]